MSYYSVNARCRCDGSCATTCASCGIDMTCARPSDWWCSDDCHAYWLRKQNDLPEPNPGPMEEWRRRYGL